MKKPKEREYKRYSEKYIVGKWLNMNLSQPRKSGESRLLTAALKHSQETAIIIKMKMKDKDPKEDPTLEMERVRFKKCSKDKLDSM